MTDITNVPSAIPYAFGHGTDDGFSMVATPAEATSQAKYMDFKKGDYLLGAEQMQLPVGTESIVHAATEGYVRLMKGEPTQRIPREPGKPFPLRHELGETDKSQWPVFNDQPSDPWKLQSELLMTIRETGQRTIFRTMSWSGREAVCDLCRLITVQRRERGDNALPIVALNTATRQHPRGNYKVPVFRIVGWLNPEAEDPPVIDLSEELQERSALSGKETATTASRPKRQQPRKAPLSDVPWENELDDSIPF